ncbi:hypothetical protein FRC02_005850, partial [Tulasnella sp. 418]
MRRWGLLSVIWMASFWLGVWAVVEMEVLWPQTNHAGGWASYEDATCPHGSSTDGTVTLTFVGTEVKLWIPRAENGVSKIRLTLDGNSDDVENNGTAWDCTRWWRYQNLTYSEHTVSVSFIPGTENKEQYLNFYKFTYLTLEETERASVASLSYTSALASSSYRASAISALSTASVFQLSTQSVASVASVGGTGKINDPSPTQTGSPGQNSNGGNNNTEVVGSKSSNNTGAIVGGVVGGIVGILIIIFLLWKFRSTLFGTSTSNNDGNDGNGEKPFTGTVTTGPPTLSNMPGNRGSGVYAYHPPTDQNTPFGVYPPHASGSFHNLAATTAMNPYDSARPLSTASSPWATPMGQPGYQPQYPPVDQFGQPLQGYPQQFQQYPQGAFPQQLPMMQPQFNPAQGQYGSPMGMAPGPGGPTMQHPYNSVSSPHEPPPGYPGRSLPLPPVPDNLTTIGSPAT